MGKYYRETEGKNRHITIGNDVWIGANSVIQSGVSIRDGAIVGNNTVVTKDVPSYASVAGILARIIRMRFSDHIVKNLKL